jgi:hypothetical protein
MYPCLIEALTLLAFNDELVCLHHGLEESFGQANIRGMAAKSAESPKLAHKAMIGCVEVAFGFG